MLGTMAQHKIRLYFFFFLARIFFSRRNPGFKKKRKAVGSVQKSRLNWVLSPALKLLEVRFGFCTIHPKTKQKALDWNVVINFDQ